MKPSLSTKLNQLTSRLEELNGLLGAQDVTRDLDRYRALSREHAEIAPIVALYRDWLRAIGVLAEPAARERDSGKASHFGNHGGACAAALLRNAS